MRLVLFNDLRFKGAGAVTRCIELKITCSTFHGLADSAALTVGCFFCRQMPIKLTLHHGFGELFDQWRENTVFAGQVFAVTQGLHGGFNVEGWFGHGSSLFCTG